MGLYEVPLSMSLLGFGMGTMLANLHMCGIMLVLRAVFNMLVRNACPRGPMCFRGLMFNMSGTCDVMSLYLLCFSVNGYVCLVRCVFDSVCELFGCGCCFLVESYGCV